MRNDEWNFKVILPDSPFRRLAPPLSPKGDSKGVMHTPKLLEESKAFPLGKSPNHSVPKYNYSFFTSEAFLTPHS